MTARRHRTTIDAQVTLKADEVMGERPGQVDHADGQTLIKPEPSGPAMGAWVRRSWSNAMEDCFIA